GVLGADGYGVAARAGLRAARVALDGCDYVDRFVERDALAGGVGDGQGPTGGAGWDGEADLAVAGIVDARLVEGLGADGDGVGPSGGEAGAVDGEVAC